MIRRMIEVVVGGKPAPCPRELAKAVERREFLRRLRPVRVAAVVAAASVLVEMPGR